MGTEPAVEMTTETTKPKTGSLGLRLIYRLLFVGALIIFALGLVGYLKWTLVWGWSGEYTFVWLALAVTAAALAATLWFALIRNKR